MTLVFSFHFSPRDGLAGRQRPDFLRSSAGTRRRPAVLHWSLAQLQGVALVLDVVVTPRLGFGRTDGGPDQGHAGLEVDGSTRVCAEPEHAVVVHDLGRRCRQRA